MSVSKKTLEKNRLDFLKDLIATRLQEVLDERHINQKEFAKRADMHVPYVNRILHRKANVTLESIAKLEVALDAELICEPEGFNTILEKKKTIPKEVSIEYSTERLDTSFHELNELSKLKS